MYLKRRRKYRKDLLGDSEKIEGFIGGLRED